MVVHMSKQQATSVSFDKLKWLAIVILLAAGIAANTYYSDVNLSLRLIGWIVLVSAALGMASLTGLGQRGLGFSKEARAELRRVVWPTRQETVRTTAMVVVLILLVGAILWGVDSILLWAVSFVTG